MAPKAFSFMTTIVFTLLLTILLALEFQGVVSSSKPSPFAFVKHLEGSQKGNHVRGLHHLKEYLKRFGYLNPNNNKSKTHHKVDSDYFDARLESAIKAYQLNYNLNVSGSLDAATASEMMVSRCGVADVVKGQTRMRSGSSASMDTTVSKYTFLKGKWPASKHCLTYAFLKGTPEIAMDTVRRAFIEWSTVTDFKLTFTEFDRGLGSKGNPDLKIGFERRAHGDGNPFDGPGGILAHSFTPTDGRCHFDADEEWTVGPLPDTFDLYTVAVHEIGHLLGLGHSSEPNAVMYPILSPGEARFLIDDDIKGMRQLYGF